MKKHSRFFIQNLDGILLRENFLIASIVTIFVIRIFLKLTDYPQLSGNGLHIAHLLWGGFFMVGAILLLLTYLGRNTVNIAAIIGGIGFGAFIDELGKFVTSDNNYFFQPTIAIIYVIFILIYSISKTLTKPTAITDKEYLVNALEMVTEAVINDLDDEEKKRAKAYLDKSNQQDQLVKSLKNFFNDIESIPTPPPSIFNQIRHRVEKVYQQITRSRFLGNIVVFLLLFQSLFSITYLGIIILNGTKLTFTEGGELISSILSGAFVIVGLGLLKRSKLDAFRSFKIAILITLLVTQFFTFYTEQFRAIFSLLLNILLLTVIDYTLIKTEKKTEFISGEKQ